MRRTRYRPSDLPREGTYVVTGTFFDARSSVEGAQCFSYTVPGVPVHFEVDSHDDQDVVVVFQNSNGYEVRVELHELFHEDGFEGTIAGWSCPKQVVKEYSVMGTDVYVHEDGSVSTSDGDSIPWETAEDLALSILEACHNAHGYDYNIDRNHTRETEG